MKAWQKGYHLEYLEEIVDRFADFNHFSCSPFSEMRKNKSILKKYELLFKKIGNNKASKITSKLIINSIK